jgi:hypothetical protein
MSDPAERPSERGVLRTLGMIAALALGGVAVFLAVAAHTQKQVQIGLLVGLWGVLLGAFTLFGPRRGPAEVSRGVKLPGAGRSAAPRREDELQLEVTLRRDMERVLRAELSQLRGEVAGLREDLVENGQSEVRLERIETTRVISSERDDMQHEVRRVTMAHSPAAAALEGSSAFPPATVVETRVKNSAPLPYVYSGQSGRDRATHLDGPATEPSLPAPSAARRPSSPPSDASTSFTRPTAQSPPETAMLVAPEGSRASAAMGAEPPRAAPPPASVPFEAMPRPAPPPAARFEATPPPLPPAARFDAMPPPATPPLSSGVPLDAMPPPLRPAARFDAVPPPATPRLPPVASFDAMPQRATPPGRPGLPAPARTAGDPFPGVPEIEHGTSVLPRAAPPPEPAPHPVSPLEALRASLAEPAPSRPAPGVPGNPLDDLPRVPRFDDQWDEPNERGAGSQVWADDGGEWSDQPQSPRSASVAPPEAPVPASRPRPPQSYVGRRRTAAAEGAPGYAAQTSQPTNGTAPYPPDGLGQIIAPPNGSANGAPHNGTFSTGAATNGADRNGASPARNGSSESGPTGGRRRRRAEGEVDDVVRRLLGG